MLQYFALPICGRAEQEIGSGALEDGRDIVLIDSAALCAEEFGGKDDVGHRDAFCGFIAVQDAAVDEQTAALGQDKLLCADKARDFPLFGINELDFGVPMLVDAVKIECPHVFLVKAEGELRFAVAGLL